MVLTTNHLVDSLNDRQHLFVADLSVAINVVQLEGPVQLVLHLAPTRYTKGADKLFEVDCSRLIGIEDVEDIVCKGRWIAKRKELLVDFLELFLREHARRAVLQESYPPSVTAWSTLHFPSTSAYLYTTVVVPSCRNVLLSGGLRALAAIAYFGYSNVKSALCSQCSVAFSGIAIDA